jgi:hypothetical protein
LRAAPPYNPQGFEPPAFRRRSPNEPVFGQRNGGCHETTILVTVALLASALSARAASVKKHLRVANARPCHKIVVTGDGAPKGAGSSSKREALTQPELAGYLHEI